MLECFMLLMAACMIRDGSVGLSNTADIENDNAMPAFYIDTIEMYYYSCISIFILTGQDVVQP